MGYGKSIEIFLANGNAESLITAEISNWNGKAIKIPRLELPKCTREDVRRAGVYFLFCQEDDGTESVYIGEAENIYDRLQQHLRDYQSGKEQFYWNTVVMFVGQDLNKALIRYLENRLVEIARECGKYKILTKNTYRNEKTKEFVKMYGELDYLNEKVEIERIELDELEKEIEKLKKQGFQELKYGTFVETEE